jgi:hypothetical protein
MKKIALVAGAVIAALVLILGILISLQPDEYHVERSATIEVPAEVVFGQIVDFRRWEDWSPWLELDPDAESTFEGAERGEGAIFKWSGNEDVGSGRMEITESRAHDYVEIDLQFIEPYESQTTTAFEFSADDPQTTTVTWKMFGENNLISKAFGLVVDMEDMIGEDYERGLARLEEASKAAYAASDE